MNVSRRYFFQAVAGVGGLTALRAQVAGPSTPPLTFTPDTATRSTVAIVKGEVRRKMVADALNAIDQQIRPVIQRKKYVVIKVNNVSTERQLAATHADTIWGILDYLQRFENGGRGAAGIGGPENPRVVVIAEHHPFVIRGAV